MYEQLTSIQSALAEHRRRALLPDPSRRRALRRNAGLSQSIVANAIGVTPAMVSRYEAGTSVPRDDVLTKYLHVLTLLAVESGEILEVHDAAGGRRRAEAAVECRHGKG
jgi:transcriptional regulator with XRE-family HTH domain